MKKEGFYRKYFQKDMKELFKKQAKQFWEAIENKDFENELFKDAFWAGERDRYIEWEAEAQVFRNNYNKAKEVYRESFTKRNEN